jgi:hypothetical protein
MRGLNTIVLSLFMLLSGFFTAGARAAPAAAEVAASLSPYSVVATTCGAGGSAGWDGTYRCRGTIGQAVQGGWWSGSEKTLYAGFWSLLLEAQYLPVPVQLVSFTADRSEEEITVNWSVAEAADLVSFHVYRQLDDGLRECLTLAPLSGRTAYMYQDRVSREVRAQYWLAETDRAGLTTWFGPVLVTAGPPLPRTLVLAAAVPNPFVFRTAITFALPRALWVRLEVFDIQGRRLATILDRVAAEGVHSVPWEGRGDDRVLLAAGVYLLRLSAGDETRTQRLVVAR